jgi:hypothetical protein
MSLVAAWGSMALAAAAYQSLGTLEEGRSDMVARIVSLSLAPTTTGLNSYWKRRYTRFVVATGPGSNSGADFTK